MVRSTHSLLYTCIFFSLAGDNGFDPLGLAEDPENLKWFIQAELVNGRWAMLGVAGMLLPEVFTKIGETPFIIT